MNDPDPSTDRPDTGRTTAPAPSLSLDEPPPTADGPISPDAIAPRDAARETAEDATAGMTDGTAAGGASAGFACPKCRTAQPESEECVRCGIVFAKYRHPRERMRERREARATRGRRVAGEGRSRTALPFKPIAAALAIAAVVSVALGTSVPGGPSPSAPRGYVPAADTASPAVRHLMELGELNDALDEMPDLMRTFFEQHLPDYAQAAGASDASVARVAAHVEEAFNATGARVAFGNWFELVLDEADIAGAERVLGTPSVEKAMAAAERHRLPEGEADYAAFVERLADAPLTSRRRAALETLVDAQSLDELMATFMMGAHEAAIRTAEAAAVGSSLPTSEQDRRTRTTISNIRDTIGWVMPSVREEAVQQLAWQLQELSLFELQMLGKAYDDPGYRELMRETGRGFDEYFRNATEWLASRLRRGGVS